MGRTWFALLSGSGIFLLLLGAWQQVPTVLMQDVDSSFAGDMALPAPQATVHDARSKGSSWLNAAREARSSSSTYSSAPPQRLIKAAEMLGSVLIPTDDARMLPPDEKSQVVRIPGYGGMWSAVPVKKTRGLKRSAAGSKLNLETSIAPPVHGPDPLLPKYHDSLRNIKRVSVFDQWSGPAKGPAVENPEMERFHAEAAHSECTDKCAKRPGWHPTEEVRLLCVKFCDTLRDDDKKEVVDPQPLSHSWWEGQQHMRRYEPNEHFFPASRQRGQILLQTSASAGTPDGLDGVNYGSKTALNDIDNYFDTLPTNDCKSADCNYQDSETLTVTAKAKKPQVSPQQLAKMERKVLGYHRKQEDAIENAELGSLDKESASLVDGTNAGYEALEAKGTKKAREITAQEESTAHSNGLHSSAYKTAKGSEHGFAGYYDNVFAAVRKDAGKNGVVTKQEMKAEAKQVAKAALVEAEKILEHQIIQQRSLSAHPTARQAEKASTQQLAGVHTKKQPAVGRKTVAGVLGYDPSRAEAMAKKEWQSLEAASKF